MRADIPAVRTAADLRAAITQHGVVLVTEPNAHAHRSVLAAAGAPYRVFLRHPFWKPLAVDLTRPPGRSGGIGTNTLHIDCVNMCVPPPIVALHCIRSDPLGGGVSWLSPVTSLSRLSAEARLILDAARFTEGQAFDLKNVGECKNTFGIFENNAVLGDVVRWSGRFFENETDPSVRCALGEASNLFDEGQIEVLLKPMETLLVDQRRFVHGRGSLGEGQQNVPTEQRRMLVQCYFWPVGLTPLDGFTPQSSLPEMPC